MANRTMLCCLASAALTFSACDSPTEPALEDLLPNVWQFVTPNVQAELDSQGHYVFPPATSPSARPIISARKAEAMAVAWIHLLTMSSVSFPASPGFEVGSLLAALEREHGRSVDWLKASPGPRDPLFAISAVQPLPSEALGPFHNFWGPHYHVPILVDRVQVASVAVAAYATGFSIDAGGTLIFPDLPVLGNEFIATGVPFGVTDGHPIPAELATVRVHQRFGTRITTLPRLIQGALFVAQNSTRWEFRLEAPVDVRLRSSGEIIRTDRIYVGQWPSLADQFDEPPFFRLRFFVADADQPLTQFLFFREVIKGENRRLDWPLVPDTPVRFLEIEPTGG